jgi:cell division protein FtsZ
LSDENTSFKDLVVRADEVLLHAVRGISDLIMSNGFINLDFADVKKVMEQMGGAMMGMGNASGENRALEAAQMAINSPLLEDISVDGAKGLLMNITGPSDMTMDEIDEASNYVKEEVSEDAEIFWGVVFDDTADNEVRVTIIATGIDDNGNAISNLRGNIPRKVSRDDYNNVVNIRDLTPDETEQSWTVRKDGEAIENLDIPTFQRLGSQPSAFANKGEVNKERKGIFGKLRNNLKDSLDHPTFLRLKAD